VFEWSDLIWPGSIIVSAVVDQPCCVKLNRPWIDGAIEGINGVARVFLQRAACYECTLEVD